MNNSQGAQRGVETTDRKRMEMQRGWDGETEDTGAERVRGLEEWPGVEPAHSTFVNSRPLVVTY